MNTLVSENSHFLLRGVFHSRAAIAKGSTSFRFIGHERRKKQMRYLDTGGRDPAHTLASWLEATVQGDIEELRLQSGFFTLDGIGLLVPALEQCKINDRLTKVLIGSNDASTLRDDVAGLVDLIGIPRHGAQLGIVSFGGAYFHPKTYYVRRVDGSQAAFVGSANLTASGLALHVEAGIALDTNEGDDPKHLSDIAAAIDYWFAEQPDGLTLVSEMETLDTLVEIGILALAPPPRTSSQDAGSGGTGRPARPRLRPLFALPSVQPASGAASPTGGPAAAAGGTTPVPAQPVVTIVPATLPSAPRTGFPPYLLFEPSATGPTVSSSALTGASLPGGGAVGLIIQLNRDSARHFMGREGTANISIPVATVSTLRFGIYGKHNRPRAEFDLKLRYVSNETVIDGGTASSNVMGYGFTAGETGHGDIRMLVPTEARSLGAAVAAVGLTPPTAGDFALLEWPSTLDPSFRLSFLDRNSALAQQAANLFNTAVAAGQIVGNGACWLPAGISPTW